VKKVAIIVDHGPWEGGTFQYNQCVVDAFSELPEQEFEKHIFYTNSFWKNYLSNYNFNLTELKLSPKLKKALKALTLLQFGTKFRKALLCLLSPKTASVLNDKTFDLLIFPSQDTVSLFIDNNKVSVIHDLMHVYESHFPEVSEGGRTKYRNILFKGFCDESKAIIVDSKIGSEQVQECYQTPATKIFQLPYLPPPHILDNEPVPADFDQKYDMLPQKFLFFPGQFWPHKNHDNLIDAVKVLANRGIVVNLAFAGKKDYNYDKIAKKISEYGIGNQITFLNFVPNEYLKGIYLKSRGLIMPTFFGPTNIPPLEAIFLGRPVAVSGIYGMMDQLKDASLYFDPKNVVDIANKMETLWQDEEQRAILVKNGEKLVANWNKKAFNDQFVEIVKKIVYS